jgi:hypothetical protein
MLQEVLAPTSAASSWTEQEWKSLLTLIGEQRVIPIVGPSLLEVEHNGAKVLLDQYLAEKLAQEFSLGSGTNLNAAICQFLSSRNDVIDLYPAIWNILEEARLAPPKPLLQLAQIRHFNLFVTTTFDPLLERALNQVRFNGKGGVVSISYAHNETQAERDLKSPRKYMTRPVVFHLLGKASGVPRSYAATEEDLLEFVQALLSKTRRPERLWSELQNNSLLVLGEHFSDWLARFFLRAVRGTPFSEKRDFREILADAPTCPENASLVQFLQNFSPRTRVYPKGDAIHFVDELWRRWCEKYPDLTTDPPPKEMPKGAVFISYSRPDRMAVQTLKDGLEGAGLSVWFDFDQLQVGDWEDKIEKGIQNCSCFVPVLSQSTEQRNDAFFRTEWCHAEKQATRRHGSGIPFFFPVVIDDTKAEDFKAIPKAFKKESFHELKDGRVTEQFIRNLQENLAKLQ